MIIPFFIMFLFLFPRENSQRVNHFLVTGLGVFLQEKFKVTPQHQFVSESFILNYWRTGSFSLYIYSHCLDA